MDTTNRIGLDAGRTREGLVRKAGRLDPGALLRHWWRRLFRGARNGIPA
jgi:hypothetical protein